MLLAVPKEPGPPTAQRRPVVLSAHGDERVDDWYWIRDRDDPALAELLEAEAAYLQAATAGTALLAEAVYDEILARAQLTDVTLPAPKGPYAYYVRTVEGLEHPIHCRRPADAPSPPTDPPEGAEPTAPADEFEQIVLDVNLLAKGAAHLELGSHVVSPDHRLLAYSTDVTGNERFTVRIRELATGTELDDTIEGAFYGLAFSTDGGTLFYTRPDDTMRPHQIWRHAIGGPIETDVCVWEEPDERFFLSVGTTKDDTLIVLTARSHVSSEARIIDARRPEREPTVVERRRQGIEYSVAHHAGELFVLTNDGAENFAVFRTPVGAPGRENWRPLVAHRESVRLERLDVVAGHVLLHERGQASTAVRIVDLTKGAETVLTPPEEAGMILLGENLEFSTSHVRYTSASLISPPAVHDYDLETGASKVVWRQRVPGYDAAAYRTERRWATSDDGTRVPITLAYRADRPEGAVPCLLYGYGAL